ncbi:cytochrome P450 [Actinomadura sp. DC4]|uniref:cytochrome P450 n=1 Tax=Actinomadura sp. DC4 TaxID=3055069 RepID=UPI0025B0CBD7|nr:cytochrome P450 [Actinomadura sp. DC4]MDN3354747.1 cytochrome P450 [Actinomadura sp. DC4]
MKHGRIPIYGPEFAADPGRVYAELRSHGSVAPVELSPGVPGMLVTGYDAALEVLRDPNRFPRDARRWQQGIPPDCPILPIMAYRPTCNLTDDPLRSRLRDAVTDSLDRVEPTVLREFVERSADTLIARIGPRGDADLLTDYAVILPLLVFNLLCGCPADLGDRMVAAIQEVLKWENSEEANMNLGLAVLELMALKRENPGPDVTTWLMDHPAGLTDEEVAHQLVMLVGAGSELAQNLIANTLRLLLSDDRFGGDLSDGSLTVEDALDEVLWVDPPLANFGVTYPVEPISFHGVELPAHEPVVISFAAANNDPSTLSDHRAGNRAHLSWGIGPHTCPAQGHARLLSTVAIEKLLDALPDMELAVPVEELVWRPGFIQRALSSLPVRFPAIPGAAPASREETPAPPPAPAVPVPEAPVPPEPEGWRRRLGRWWAGETG